MFSRGSGQLRVRRTLPLNIGPSISSICPPGRGRGAAPGVPSLCMGDAMRGRGCSIDSRSPHPNDLWVLDTFTFFKPSRAVNS